MGGGHGGVLSCSSWAFSGSQALGLWKGAGRVHGTRDVSGWVVLRCV